MPKRASSTLIFSLSLLLVVSAFAAEKKSEPQAMNLRLMAREEASSAGTAKDAATDAQITDGGILRLVDPGLRESFSPWTWQAGVRVQRMAPRGNATMSNGQDLDLNGLDSALYPIVGLGVSRLLSSEGMAAWNAGLKGEVGYGSQDTDVTYISGVSPTDTRLSTGMAAVTLSASARFHRLAAVQWEAGWVEGLLTYSHAASDSAVNFTRQGRFRGPRLGVFYWPTTAWSVGLENETRSSNDLELQTNNLSLGTRMTW